jgi:hypothetical protein
MRPVNRKGAICMSGSEGACNVLMVLIEEEKHKCSRLQEKHLI